MKKAGSDPQGPSSKLNKAVVLVMGSFLDQTARAIAERKEPRAVTDTAAPSHNHEAHQAGISNAPSQACVETPGEGSNSRDLSGGDMNSATQSTSYSS